MNKIVVYVSSIKRMMFKIVVNDCQYGNTIKKGTNKMKVLTIPINHVLQIQPIEKAYDP